MIAELSQRLAVAGFGGLSPESAAIFSLIRPWIDESEAAWRRSLGEGRYAGLATGLARLDLQPVP